MKKPIYSTSLIFSILLICQFGRAQQATTTAGSTISNSNISVSYSIGEWAIQKGSTQDINVFSGVIQPKFEEELDLVEISNINTKVFPNPVSDVINIEQNETVLDTYSIYGIDGKLVKTGAFQQNINGLGNLQTGTYLLLLHNSKQYTSQLFEKI